MIRESGIPIGEIAMDLRPQRLVRSGTHDQQEGMGGQKIEPKLPRRRFLSRRISTMHSTLPA